MVASSRAFRSGVMSTASSSVADTASTSAVSRIRCSDWRLAPKAWLVAITMRVLVTSPQPRHPPWPPVTA